MNRLLGALGLSMLSSIAFGGELELGNSGSIGCGEQWASDCIANDVWGPEQSLGIDEQNGVLLLTMAANDKESSKIAVDLKPVELNGNTGASFHLMGYAGATATVVGMEIVWIDEDGAIVGKEFEIVHQGASGLFSYWWLNGAPTGASSFKARVVTSGGYSVIQEAGSDCFIPGCNPPTDPPPVSTGDNGGHGCDGSCERDCGDYTAIGMECTDGCTAVCNGVYGNGLFPQAHEDVVLSH